MAEHVGRRRGADSARASPGGTATSAATSRSAAARCSATRSVVTDYYASADPSRWPCCIPPTFSRPTTSAGSIRRRSTKTPRARSAARSSPISTRSASRVSRDMRLSSPSIAAAFIDGAREQGADVVDYGMARPTCCTSRVVRDGLDGGAQITASHNPKEYNGIKMVRQEAFPLSGDAGIGEIRDMVTRPARFRRRPRPRGGVETRDAARRLRREGHVGSSTRRPSSPFNVVLDAGSGMAGLVAPRLFDRLPCRTTRLCFEIDGTFPNHEANPLIEENRRDIVERVIAEKADIGIAWDGDADRCFFIDGTGEFIAGDFITALLAEAALIKSPGEKIIYDVRASYAVKDIVADARRHARS